VSTTLGNTGNPGNLLEFEIASRNTGNSRNFVDAPGQFYNWHCNFCTSGDF